MVGGQYDKVTVGAIIQARMDSKRLPGKVMMPMPFPNGQPLIEHAINNYLMAGISANIYVATSADPLNDPIQKFCENKGIRYFRGSENDVLSRFVAILEKENWKHVIRLTADNPFSDSGYLNTILAKHLSNYNDYTVSSGMPLGMNVEIIKVQSLLEIAKSGKMLSQDKEHVTSYFKRNKDYKSEIIQVDTGLEHLRLTVDNPSDFAISSLIVQKLNDKKIEFSDIKKLMKDCPWLQQINSEELQKPVITTLKDEVDFARRVLNRYELKNAVGLLDNNFPGNSSYAK